MSEKNEKKKFKTIPEMFEELTQEMRDVKRELARQRAWWQRARVAAKKEREESE